MKQGAKTLIGRAFDLIAAPATLLFAPLAAVLGRLGGHAPVSRAILDRFHIGIARHHYYHPLVFPSDIRHDLRDTRHINGLDLNEAGQLALLRQFHYRDELLVIPLHAGATRDFHYLNPSFTGGDAEYLYDMIRHFKPRRILEIGSGASTLMARRAILQNRQEDPGYACEQICIEPYEMPWLEQVGVKVMREKIEDCPAALFQSLDKNDILFIDSTHVIRPQGDVLFEYLHILGALAPGVIIHAHDIFTPFDYPVEWVLKERRIWTEQYLLEAFLCFNSAFEVIGAVNWLNRLHRDKLEEACPILVSGDYEPGSFWFRRIR